MRNLFDAVGFVIDGTNDGQSCASERRSSAEINLIEEVDEQIGRGRAAVDYVNRKFPQS